MSKFDEDILKMIFMIKKKPMFLVEKSVSCLRSFLDGFAAGYTFPNAQSFFPNFQVFIEQRYSCDLTISWNQILLRYTNDEEAAFYLFFKEFESFLQANNIKAEML